MTQVTTHLPEELEDLRLGLERLQDPGDPVLDWKEAKSELLARDQG